MLKKLKSDPRGLYWLAKKITIEPYFHVSVTPTNYQEIETLITNYENHLKKTLNQERYKREMNEIMSEYFENILPQDHFNWLYKLDSQGLYWVWVYLNFNPICTKGFRPSYLPIEKGYVETHEAIIPLIINTFDNSHGTLFVDKQNYLEELKIQYSKFLSSERSLNWLKPNDTELLGWVWNYICKRSLEFNFLAPITSKDYYWAINAVISNWQLLLRNQSKLYIERPTIRFRLREGIHLPTAKELIDGLNNSYKQKKHRMKSISSPGLTKANQKKLTSYAKEQNTTEKKALNEIVKTMLD